MNFQEQMHINSEWNTETNNVCNAELAIFKTKA